MGWNVNGELEKMGKCRKTVRKFTHVADNCNTKIIILIRCNSQWCPSCRSKRDRAMLPKVEKLIRSFQRPTKLELTLPSMKSLAEMRKLIKMCFAKLQRKKIWKDYVRAGIWGIGLTFSHEKGWHYHIHVAVDTWKYWPWQKVAAAWSDITGGAMIGTPERIKSVKGYAAEIIQGSRKGGKRDWETLDVIFSDPSRGKAVRDEVMTALHNARFFQTFGKASLEKKPEKIPMVCPACGAHFNIRDWIIEVVSLESVNREMFNGSAGSLQYYSRFESKYQRWKPPPDYERRVA